MGADHFELYFFHKSPILTNDHVVGSIMSVKVLSTCSPKVMRPIRWRSGISIIRGC